PRLRHPLRAAARSGVPVPFGGAAVTEVVTRREVLRAGAGGAGLWLGGIALKDLLNGVAAASETRFRPRASADQRSQDDLAYLTIAEAADLIARRKLSPVELVDACL